MVYKQGKKKQKNIGDKKANSEHKNLNKTEEFKQNKKKKKPNNHQ